MGVGGWVQISLNFVVGKLSQNNPILLLVYFDSYTMCILCVSKDVKHYDLSVQSMSVMGFHNKFLDKGVGGDHGLNSISFFWSF